MGSGKEATSSQHLHNNNNNNNNNNTIMDTSSIQALQQRQHKELQNLTLTTQPFRTLNYFLLAVINYHKRTILYIWTKGGVLLLLMSLLAAIAVLAMTFDGPHEKHVEELSKYFRFGLWWIALGVASSIGLGSGLHTFVLYLGPHIALFTIKAMQCGRIDLKRAVYDTIQLKSGPSWLDEDCDAFGPPLFTSPNGIQIPITSILPQVQIEAVLWGVGTALGELPPYFISRAARISGTTVDAMEELDETPGGFMATHLNRIKRWFLSQSQHLNFLTILILASVPNPLFDLAGIMCGQFGIPFWKFFFATLIGKALIKTHIQTVFIISVCNNQLLDWIENELILVLGLIPGFDSSYLHDLKIKIDAMKDKYMKPSPPSNIKVKKWDFSFNAIWNTVVWLMLLNFFIKIVNSTSQGYLKKRQEADLAEREKKASAATHTD